MGVSKPPTFKFYFHNSPARGWFLGSLLTEERRASKTPRAVTNRREVNTNVGRLETEVEVHLKKR